MKHNIAHLFFNSSQTHRERIAIIERDTSITYGDLEQQIAQTVAYFRKKGIQSGDRVLVFVPMSVDLYRITLALFSIGAVAVFLDEWVSLKRLKLCCEIADCKAFIAAPKIRFLGWFIPVIRRIPIHLSLSKQNWKARGFEVLAVEQDAPALITFTTGSVGTPKAAVRSHEFLRIQFQALHPLLNHENEREMIMLPIVLLLNLASGKTSVLPDFKFSKPHTFDAQKIWKQMQQHRIQGLVASPHYLIELAKYKQTHRIAHPLNTIVSGGSAIFPSDAALVLQAFTATKFTIVYGSTEAEPISHCSAEELIENQTKTGVFVGAIDPIAQVCILRLQAPVSSNCSAVDFENHLCSTGETGEILVAGEHVLNTYLRSEEIFEKNKIVVGQTIWHRTGDAGYLLNNGALFLMGRAHQIFTADQIQVYPFVAEKLLRELAGVRLGTIIQHNNQPVLVYQADHDMEESSLRAIFPQVPLAKIIRLKEIPVDPRHRSKIEYAALKNLIQLGLAGKRSFI